MSAYGYNALGMYVKRSRSLPVSGGQSPDGLTTGGGNAWNISCVPDFLGSAGSELMAYREGTASPFAGETRFTSYPYDPVTGVYFAHARLYDADLGRMLSKDPVKRGLNGYPYCGNDPVNHTDPTGEIPPCWSLAQEGESWEELWALPDRPWISSPPETDSA